MVTQSASASPGFRKSWETRKREQREKKQNTVGMCIQISRKYVDFYSFLLLWNYKEIASFTLENGVLVIREGGYLVTSGFSMSSSRITHFEWICSSQVPGRRRVATSPYRNGLEARLILYFFKGNNVKEWNTTPCVIRWAWARGYTSHTVTGSILSALLAGCCPPVLLSDSTPHWLLPFGGVFKAFKHPQSIPLCSFLLSLLFIEVFTLWQKLLLAGLNNFWVTRNTIIKIQIPS